MNEELKREIEEAFINIGKISDLIDKLSSLLEENEEKLSSLID